MGGVTQTYVALDGSTVNLTSNTTASEVFTSDGVVSMGNAQYEFTAGPLNMGQKVADNPEISVGMLFTEFYSLHGGTLRVGSGQQPVGFDEAVYTEPFRLAIWEGAGSSVHSSVYGGDSAELVYAFNQVSIREIETGVVLSPANGDKALQYVTGPGLGIDVPPIALLDIVQLTDRVAEMLPNYNGTEVEGGELFKAGTSGSEPVFLLVSPTAVTYIMPHSWTDRQTVLEFISGMAVEWHVN